MEITRSQFKKLILLQATLFVGFIIASFFTPALLPAELQDYLNKTLDQDLSTVEIIVAVLGLPIVVWALQNLVALYQFRSYAPKHLVYITLLSVIFYLNLQAAVVYSNVDALINDTLFLLNGFTIAIVFFSNIAQEFKQPQE